MPQFIDIHQHLLFGVDDGPKTLQAACDMLHEASAQGIHRIIATPHAVPGESVFPAAACAYRLAQLREYAAANGLDIQLFSGAEILYTGSAAVRALQAGDAPRLADGRFVLVEFLPDDPYETLHEAARQLSNAGFHPIYAHIERYDCLIKDIRRVEELKSLFDVRMQVNCATFVHRKRFAVRRFVRGLLKASYLDYVATDAHNMQSRPIQMRACYDALASEMGAAAAQALTGGNQREIFPN